MGEPKVLSSYLLLDKKVSIVDCGPTAVIDELLSLAVQCGVRPSAIDNLLLTHIHIDHAGGAAKFLERCPNVNAYIPESGFKHMIDPSALNISARKVLGDEIFDYWRPCDPVKAERARSVKPRQKLDLGKIQVEYVPATGHAPHHNIIVDEPDSCIFSADALGIYDSTTDLIVPTTPPPSLDLPQSLRDIELIEYLNPTVACMAHYEEINPSKRFYTSLKNVFDVWSLATQSYAIKENLASYSYADCESIFGELVKDHPQYSALSGSPREQAIRVDVAGLLDYFVKHPANA
ncbi:MAG: MBL fold metallo-hydrolase [Nitrososphaerota archaeon]|nr:MBL fold metallo-hydrolase [Nitrososphaerota archaeon]